MTTSDTQELIEALEPCPWCRGKAVLRKDDDPGYPFYVTFDHADACPMYAVPTDLFRSFATEAEAITAWNARARSADEQPTPPDDLAEVRKIETVMGTFLTEPGEPFWRIEIGGYCADFDHEQAARNFAGAINARLQALSPHLSEREKIVAWLRDVADQFPTHPLLHFIGDPWTDDGKHLARDIADAISRGDHISGEGRW